MEREYALEHDDVLGTLIIRPRTKEELIKECQKVFEDYDFELFMRTLLHEYVRVDHSVYIITDKGWAFYNSGGYFHQWELENATFEALQASKDSLHVSKQALAKAETAEKTNNTIKRWTKGNTIVVTIAAIFTIYLAVIEPDSRRVLHKLLNLLLHKQ